MNYTLDTEGKPKPEPDLMAWAGWMKTAERHVAKDSVNGLRVSTVFLGLDHQFGEGPPILYETMVFREGEWLDLGMDRYSTREEAVLGHAAMLKRAAENPDSFGKE